MNKEIKEEIGERIEKIFQGSSDTGKYAWSGGRDELMELVEDFYLLGAKDMWDMVDREAWLVKTKQIYPYADIEERLELITEHITTKAQQFIDSLTKENKDDAK